MKRFRERSAVFNRNGLLCMFPPAMVGLVLEGLVLVMDHDRVLARVAARAVHDWTWRLNGSTQPGRFHSVGRDFAVVKR